MKKLVFFIIILALAIGAIGFWYYQKNIYSKETLKLEILGQGDAKLAQEVEYIVKYKNNGDVRLENPKLIFEYPENSIVVGGESEFLRQEEVLDDIYPGEEKTFSFKARLIGKEGEAKIAKVWLNYQPQNLNTRYESSTTLTTVIKEVPLTFEFDASSQIEAEKKILLKLNYFSNLDYPLSDLGIKLEYPSGFEFIESRPKTLEKTEWDIPLLNKAAGGRIEISGTLQGDVDESKIFRASLGVWQNGEFVLLKEAARGVEISQPSIYISQLVNNSSQYVAQPGDYLHYEISFKNIGDKTLEDLFLVVQFEGQDLDSENLKLTSGKLLKDSNSIIWDKTMMPQLGFLSGMDEGKVEFWLKISGEPNLAKNPVIRDKVTLGKTREEFITKVSSKLEISQKGYYQDEVFGNTGSIPPKVGAATTYTILWQIKNYYSDIKNAKVKATLGTGVALTSKIFPEDLISKFKFDSKSKEIIWSIGDLAKGVGVSQPDITIAFQVSFTPTKAQKGQTPEIISQAEFSGDDVLSESFLQTMALGLTTVMPDDASVGENGGVVQ